MELLTVESSSVIVGFSVGQIGAVFVSATTVLLATLAALTLTLVWLNGRKSSSHGQTDSVFLRIKDKAERLIRSHVAKSAKTAPVAPSSSPTSQSGTAEQQLKAWSPPPGPVGWPIIGSLHLLGKYEVPFEAFSQLSKTYGDIFSITLGSTPCVVVNSFKLIKEVLITKGPHFGGRPNFIRYDILFGGDRDNCKSIRNSFSRFHVVLAFAVRQPSSACRRTAKKMASKSSAGRREYQVAIFRNGKQWKG